MSDPLQLAYRPRTFRQLIGQNLNAIVLQRLVDAGDVPHGLLFSGPSGTGKTSAARILAAEMNPDHKEEVLDGVSLAVTEIDAASNGGVAEIRKLMETLRYETIPGAKRVVIIDECHSITRDGFNALLKPTEEESGTTFVFVTTEPEKIPGTVLSRLTEFEFRRVSPGEVFERLQHVAVAEDISCSEDLLHHIAAQSQGNVRSALTTLNLVARAGIRSVREFQELRGEDDYGPRLLSTVASGDHSAIFEELDHILASVGNPGQVSVRLARVLRDLLVLRSGGTLSYTGSALELRKNLALQIDPEKIFAALKLLWELKTRVRGSQDGIGDLETALILVSGILAKGNNPKTSASPASPPTPLPVPKTEETRPLTLAELQRLT